MITNPDDPEYNAFNKVFLVNLNINVIPFLYSFKEFNGHYLI